MGKPNNQTQPEATPDLVRPNRFLERYPDLATAGALRWQLYNSASNGLDAAGAVIRKFARPGAKRPTIFIDTARYFNWLRSAA